MAPSTGRILVGRESALRPVRRSPSSFDLLARTRPGATTVSREHWPTWGTRSRTRPWAMFSVDTSLSRRPKRGQTTTWKDFIRSHMAVLAGTDFFTVEVLPWRGLANYYVLFFFSLR